jgi:putative transposase
MRIRDFQDITEYCVALFFHTERNHQGKGNVILFPTPADRIGKPTGEIQTRERLVGLLEFYHRKAA